MPEDKVILRVFFKRLPMFEQIDCTKHQMSESESQDAAGGQFVSASQQSCS
jgi:hypothetical protein